MQKGNLLWRIYSQVYNNVNLMYLDQEGLLMAGTLQKLFDNLHWL